MAGDRFTSPAGIPGARAISEAILKGILKKILLSFSVTGVGKVLFGQSIGITTATKLQMQTVHSDIDVAVDLSLKKRDASGKIITRSTATKKLTIRLATIDLGAGGVSVNDTTGIVKALNKTKKHTKDRFARLNSLVYNEIKKLYPNEKVYPLK